jgi:lysyl oxidase
MRQEVVMGSMLRGARPDLALFKALGVRLAALGGVVAATVLIWPAGASAQVTTPLYPDVRALPPEDVRLGRETINFDRHYVIRFSTIMYNAGPGQLELHGTPASSLNANFDATQWIYEDPAGVQVQHTGAIFMFHQAHNHFHFDGYGRYELWTKRAFERAQANGFTSGGPVFVSPKVSFCMIDSREVDTETSQQSRYNTCTPAMQGVSAGWADIYGWSLPDQWIDVGLAPLPDGEYVLRNIVDPFNVIFESEGRADPAKESEVANSGVTPVRILNGQLAAS